MDLLSKYGNSIRTMVCVENPEVSWKAWEFDRTPHGWWALLAELFKQQDPVTVALVRMFVDELAKVWNITALDEWSKVALKEKIRSTPLAFHLYELGGLTKVLQQLYPDHPWRVQKRGATNRKQSSYKWQYQVKQKLERLV